MHRTITGPTNLVHAQLIAVNAFVRSRRGRTVVIISETGVEIRERGAWFTRTTHSILLGDIMDVDYSTKE